jgi:regulation of enolase protein 1 (concanavalin A-like superfamily)
VACLTAATAPTLPAVTSNCGETLTPSAPVITDSPDPLTCEGTRTYAYTYADCEGNTATWSFVYTIEREPFTVPGNGASTVACLAAATAPTLPAVTSNCGETLTPSAPVITDSPNPLTCEGTRTYAYTYADCEGNTVTWSFVYTIEGQPFTAPANGAATVNDPDLATQPTPPMVMSNCGEPLIPVGPVVTNDPNPIVCTGTRTYTWTYTDCEGNTAIWSFVYTIIDNTPPMVTCSNQTVTFNGQQSIALNVNTLATATDNCGTPSLSVSPSFITCQQVGQIVPVTVTATDASNNLATCTSNITVAGLPCGWSQNPNGVGCEDGNSIGYNPGTGVWTATSTNCLYGPPFTSDASAFAQRSLCGDGSITAQVTSINGSALGWAGIVMRESNAAGAKKAQLMTNLSNFSRREFRTTTNGAASPQQFPSQDRYWLRIVRTGSQFSMYVSANGLAWYFVGAQNVPMNACIQVGLVATNYQQTSTVTATFANVGFTGSNVPVLAGASTPLSTLEPATNASTPLSTNNEQRSTDFQVYPNPTSGELNVDLAQYLGRAVRLEVYSLTGQLLRFVEIDEVQTAVERLDLSGFAGGMYLIRVKSDGLPDATKRIVVTR